MQSNCQSFYYLKIWPWPLRQCGSETVVCHLKKADKVLQIPKIYHFYVYKSISSKTNAKIILFVRLPPNASCFPNTMISANLGPFWPNNCLKLDSTFNGAAHKYNLNHGWKAIQYFILLPFGLKTVIGTTSTYIFASENIKNLLS